MSKITGTNLAAPIVPYDSADTYPTHMAALGKGGWRSVANIDARNAIPADRLEEGAACYVNENRTPYVYLSGVWTEFADADRSIVAAFDEIATRLDGETIRNATAIIGMQAMMVGMRNELNGKL
jgi:hypothetical protein